MLLRLQSSEALSACRLFGYSIPNVLHGGCVSFPFSRVSALLLAFRTAKRLYEMLKR